VTNIIFSRFLDTNGDGTGTKDAVGNYASDTDFYIECPANQKYVVSRVLVTISDTGSLAAGEYGNISLTGDEGVSIIIEQRGVENDLTDGIPITSNACWHRIAGVDMVRSSFGSGDDFLSIRYSFFKHGTEVVLNTGDKLIARLNGNLSGLTSHYFTVQGYY